MSDENSSNWLTRIFGFIARNPINIICALVLGYCAIEAYLLNNSPIMYKGAMLGVVGVWGFLFIAKHMFKVILLIAVIGAAIYGWIWFSGRDKAACEEKGGYWNKNTLTCEEKVSFMDQLKKLLKIKIGTSSK